MIQQLQRFHSETDGRFWRVALVVVFLCVLMTPARITDDGAKSPAAVVAK